MATEPVRSTAVVAAPKDYSIPAAQLIRLLSVRAAFTDNSAASNWLPAVQLLDNNGNVLMTAADQGVSVTAGSNADVTWFPGVKHTSSSSGALPILDFVAFTPAGNQLQITSTNPAAPTLVITTPSITFDGSETVQVQFYASAIDLDQRGNTGQAAVLLELYVDNTPSGIIADYNADPGLYFITSCYVSAFDTPSAGSHTYSIRGYLQVAGGSGPGPSFVYGTGVGTPHATRPGFLVLLKATT